LCFFLQ
jgi:hypothetical protein